MNKEIQKYVPILKWLPRYKKKYFKPDLFAGLILSTLIIPTCMAFAQMAGVPAEYGFITALAAMAGYAIFGSSKQVIVTATSIIALMSATIVAPLAINNPDKFIPLTAGLALIAGIILVLGGVFKLGSISKFFSESVITGFIFGMALTIIATQLPKIFGVEVESKEFFQSIWELIVSLNIAQSWTLFVGGSSLALLFLFKRFLPKLPGPLLVLAYGTLITTFLGLENKGVVVTGEILSFIPNISIPQVNVFEFIELIPGAFAIALVGFAETISIGREYANKKGYEVKPNQELIGLGASNVFSGLFSGFAVDASLSKTVVNENSGAKTLMSSIFSGIFLIITLIFLTPLFYNLPEATLAAIIIYAVMSLLNVKELKRYYRIRKTEFWIAIVAIIGVLIFDVLLGLIIAIVLSMLVFIYRASQPKFTILGKHPRKEIYGDIKRDKIYKIIPGLLIIRIDAPLFFANATYLNKEIKKIVKKNKRPIDVVILNLEATNNLDFSSIDTLYELPDVLKEFGVEVWLARVHGKVMDIISKTKLSKKYNTNKIFLTTDLAVENYKKKYKVNKKGEKNDKTKRSN